MPIRTLVGAVVGAALLGLLAFSPGRPAAGHLPQVRPWRPTVAQRFAAAMQASGHDLVSVRSSGGVVVAVVRVGAADALPRLRVDASLAASTVRHSCRCDLIGYRVLTDRFGPDPMLVASGRALPTPAYGAPSDTTWHMDGASDQQVERRARFLVRNTGGASSSRVTVTILRGGQIALVSAWRPRTGEGWSWSVRGIQAPRLPRAAAPHRPQTPFTVSQ